MKNILVYKLFDRCINAYANKKFENMVEVLNEISTLKLQPKARILYERLRVLADQKVNEHASRKALTNTILSDIAVIILMGHGEPEALAKSINSIEYLRGKGLSVHCLLLECLPFDTDVINLSEKNIQQLPVCVSDKLNDGSLDYVVEYGYTNKALRRVVRCAGGRYISFIREGDELFLADSTAQDIPSGYDLLISSPNRNSVKRLNNLSQDKYKLGPLTALFAAEAFYDGSLLIDRDYLDDLLGLVKYDGIDGYFGYINEVLSVELTFEPARFKFIPYFGCNPTSENKSMHIERMSYTLHCIESRRNQSLRQLEPKSEKLIANLLHVARDVLLDDSRQENSIDLNDNLMPLISGILPEQIKFIIRWYAQEVRELALSDKPKEYSPLAINNINYPSPILGFVSSIFKGQKLLNSYFENIVSQSIFDKSEIVIVSPEPNLIQDLLIKIFELSCPRIKLIQFDEDPGIYECWNVGIRYSQAEFITNANLDDRRSANHAEKLLAVLQSSNADVASSAICITKDMAHISKFDGNLELLLNTFNLEQWFTGGKNQVSEKKLNDFFLWNGSDEVIQCMNFPHCMPVWRRSIHDKFGYFDELSNGTYADFALWLKAASSGAKFIHLTEPCGLYYVDPNSHNRRNADEKKWQNIVTEYLPSSVKIISSSHMEGTDNQKILNPFIQSVEGVPKINFGTQISQNFGNHRSGWSYALAGLQSLHDPAAPVFCDAFIEKKFVWGGDLGDGGSGPVVPYSQPWIGFVHVPPYVPSWFQSEQSNQRIFSRKSWLKSMENCHGLFTLTNYHRDFLLKILKPVFPVSTLYHPTEFPEVRFNFDKYKDNQNKRIIQVGWWLRKLSAIKNIASPNHVPTLLGKSDWTKNILTYSEARIAPSLDKRIDVIEYLDNKSYDNLLSENIVFIDFYDTSANNAVIECIARGTPIIICRHPAVEEYLGKDYPLFYNDYKEIEMFLKDSSRIEHASNYMNGSAIRQQLKIDVFRDNFIHSEVLRALI